MKYIIDTSWLKLADIDITHPVEELPPDKSIVHCHMDEVADFFNLIENSKSKNRYILISSRSDYSICYQKDHPVSDDMPKCVHFNKIEVDGYSPLIINSRCDVNNCKISDRYSIKMYQYTKATINKIPENIIKWFCVNADIDDSRIVRIPFGVNEDFIKAADGKLVDRFLHDDFFPCYMNFSFNNLERVSLYREFCKHPNFIAKRDVAYDEYISDVISSKSVLCPPGNGLDTYRHLETLYLGKLPVVTDNSRILSAYSGSPYITLGFLVRNHAGMFLTEFNYENSIIDFSYWEKKIEDSRSLL